MNKYLNILLVLIIIGFIGYKFYQSPKFNDGEDAPEIEATLKNGKSFKLSELKGKYVLIDFWASWCGPCRRENKYLTQLYNEFNPKGLEIVSIAIETGTNQWERAIIKDNLNWPFHIVQKQRFKSPIAKLYGIKAIPTKYLLDRNGKIIGVDLSIDETKQILSQNLKIN